MEAIEHLYKIIDDAPMILFASVIDKRQMTTKYVLPDSATTLAYKHLLERIEKFLKNSTENHFGIIIHDLIQEATGNSRSYQREIIEYHEQVLHRGRTDEALIEHIVEGVHFVETDQSNFLQVADLVAYNIYRQFTDSGDQWDSCFKMNEVEFWRTISTYSYFKRVLNKFDRSEMKRIRGYGIKKFPEV